MAGSGGREPQFQKGELCVIMSCLLSFSLYLSLSLYQYGMQSFAACYHGVLTLVIVAALSSDHRMDVTSHPKFFTGTISIASRLTQRHSPTHTRALSSDLPTNVFVVSKENAWTG